MQMLVDKHWFHYYASVPFPIDPMQSQIDWVNSFLTVEKWLEEFIGGHYSHWAWSPALNPDWIGVSFKLQKDATFFLLRWEKSI